MNYFLIFLLVTMSLVVFVPSVDAIDDGCYSDLPYLHSDDYCYDYPEDVNGYYPNTVCYPDLPYLHSDDYCYDYPENSDYQVLENTSNDYYHDSPYYADFDPEYVCFTVFADVADILNDILFFQAVYDLPHNAELWEFPPDVGDRLNDDLNWIMSEFDTYGCADYRYLLTDDEYLDFRMYDVHEKMNLLRAIDMNVDYPVTQYSSDYSLSELVDSIDASDILGLMFKLLI